MVLLQSLSALDSHRLLPGKSHPPSIPAGPFCTSGLKVELIHAEQFETPQEVKYAVFGSLEVPYNRFRWHPVLGYAGPAELERNAAPAAGLECLLIKSEAMRIRVGEVEALYRYPVKSMRGELLEVADLGWHGLDGDRRLAFRRPDDRGGFPWLTASRLPELILFAPQPRGPGATGNLPTHVRTPDGQDLTVFGHELATEVGRRHGSPVEMVHLNRGIFDEASISLITSTTVGEVSRLAAQRPDVRRFRPNVLIASSRSVAFEEDEWVGGVLSFGESAEAAALFITNRDARCSMVNFDPDSARPATAVLKAIVRVRNNTAGVYGTVARRSRLAVGQPVFFEPLAVR